MSRKDEILLFCQQATQPVTAREIVTSLYPGKTQPYVNDVITELVKEGFLIRDNSRPYTVVASGKENVVTKTEIKKAPKVCQGMISINTPCPDEVDKYVAQWNELEHYYAQEQALDKLFFETYPSNTDLNDVLVKVSTLNDFYSTNIFSPYTVAKNIVEQNIDGALQNGDISIVEKIARVEISGKDKYFYSFATKYCSHHRPDAYPIYDSYVDQLLRYFRKRDKFCEFSNPDLKNYSEFTRILNEFQKFYGLEKYSVKDVDKYLWQLGKEKFPKKY